MCSLFAQRMQLTHRPLGMPRAKRQPEVELVLVPKPEIDLGDGTPTTVLPPRTRVWHPYRLPKGLLPSCLLPPPPPLTDAIRGNRSRAPRCSRSRFAEAL